MENQLIDVIKAIPQWVLHNVEKVPYQVGMTERASVSDPSTWTTYEEVAKFQHKGFVLTQDDPYTVIDLDHCVGKKGVIDRCATKKILYFGSYTELSPSGTGVHIWVLGEMPAAIKRKEFEIYSSSRYMTVTANPLFNYPIVDCQLKLDAIWEKHGKANLFEGQQEIAEPVDCVDDLRKLYRVSTKLRDIWNLSLGFYKADGSPDCSAYDMSLAGLLKDWSASSIAGAIQFFRKEKGFKSKNSKAVMHTISKAMGG